GLHLVLALKIPPLSHVLLDNLPLYCLAILRDLHSFPTRRSSDLSASATDSSSPPLVEQYAETAPHPHTALETPGVRRLALRRPRSEEHTSELQSRENLVCRLLLEKKNHILKGMYILTVMKYRD